MEVGRRADNTKGKDLLLTDLLIGHRADAADAWHGFGKRWGRGQKYGELCTWPGRTGRAENEHI